LTSIEHATSKIIKNLQPLKNREVAELRRDGASELIPLEVPGRATIKECIKKDRPSAENTRQLGVTSIDQASSENISRTLLFSAYSFSSRERLPS